MKIAIIGSGISGLSAALLLSQKHQITIFEIDKRYGGHANTVKINKESIVGAGSIITKNVKKKSLALTRSVQLEIKNYKRKTK